MPVNIENMTSHVEVLPGTGDAGAGGASSAGPGGAVPQDMDELIEALRPVVMQLTRAELDEHMRTRG